MNQMYLYYFTNDENFHFFIQYGQHDDGVFMHSHADFSELVIVLEGEAVHIVNDEKYTVRKGDVFVINSNTSHGYKSPENFQICNIMYRPDELFAHSSDLMQSAGYHALFVIEPYLAKEQCFESRLKLDAAEFDEANNLIANMIDEYECKRDGRKTLIMAYFTQLVTILSRKYTLPSESDRAGINLAKSVSYMESHFDEKITIQTLAEISFISERHFSRIFRATYHVTPGTYLNEIRMKQASRLLRSSDLSVTEIAVQSGFTDSNFFARQFHKTFGISPSEYRKNNTGF